MPNPRHVNPNNNPSTATYNFVPLPESVLSVAGEGDDPVPQRCRSHDRWMDGHHRGWIELTIETLTPLFIRGPLTRGDAGWDQREARRRPDGWLTAGGLPVIPGSSLRGMVRTLVEILAFAKLAPVSQDRPFFRTFLPDRIGGAYRDRLVRGEAKPEGGFLRRHGDRWSVERAGGVLRVTRDVLYRDLGLTFAAGPSKVPPPGGQHLTCWVADDGASVSRISDQSLTPGRKGTLVLTGNAAANKAEFVFLESQDATRVEVPEQVWQRFHDEDQITNWQKKAFPPDGRLKDGDPVFFVTRLDNANTVDFLGRAKMFRFPYDLAVGAFVPEGLRDRRLDMAEAIFGRVAGHGEDRRLTIKGRVFFEDCDARSARDSYLEQQTIVPRILSSPKPTTFSHYLTQDGRLGHGQRATYLQGDQGRAAVRGHKLYWHRWDERGLAMVRDPGAQVPLPATDTQRTVMCPVRDGVTFGGRIRFDNLDDNELGALLAALDLPEDCAHKLGMARPLGLGSVRITPTLHLVDSDARYRSWATTGELPLGETAEIEKRCRSAFEGAVLDHARISGEVILQNGSGLGGVARLDALFTMLQWKKRPEPGATADLAEAGGPKAFGARRVLPTPHEVTGLTDPWPLPAPPGPAPGRSAKGGEHDRRGPSSPSRSRGPGPNPPSLPAPSLLKAVVLEEKTTKGKPLVRLTDKRTGYLDGTLPPDIMPGDALEVVWLADGQPHCRLAWVDPAHPPPPPRPPARRAPPKSGRRQ